MTSKILIAYFSRPGNNYAGGGIVHLPIGNTEVAANMIAELTGGSLFKLDPVNKYPEDYNACTAQAQEELRSGARPVLTTYPDSIDGYDTVILGYPNWWGTMPMPVWTFLERYNFSGKIIYPFCTHEGSGMGRSEGDIKKLCPKADVKAGLAIRGGSVKSAGKDISAWLKF